MYVVADPDMFAMNPDVPGFHHTVTRPQSFQLRRDEMIAVPTLEMMDESLDNIWPIVVYHIAKTGRKD